MRTLAPLTALTLCAALAGCVAETAPALEEGAYVLRGEATMDTPAGPQPKSESLVLFVDASGTPTHVRDQVTGDSFAVSFAGETSADLCTYDGCDLFIERATGCAVYEFTDYFRIIGFGDAAHSYTGTVRACPTDESFEYRFDVRGTFVDDLLMPEGELRIETNFPMDPTSDTIAMTIDGAPTSGTTTPSGADALTISLGTLPINTRFELAYTGPRGFAPSYPTPFQTSAVLSDLSLATAPVEGSIDSRGRPVVYEDGALVLRDEGRGPREPFATLIALGDPGTASTLNVDVEVQRRAGGNPEMRLVRADGTSSATVLLWDGAVDVPPGTGEVYLLLQGRQDVPAPSDLANPLVFTLSGLAWE